MKFVVTATQPLPDEVAAQQSDPNNPGVWLEAEEYAETLEDALQIIQQWVGANEVEPYGHGPVDFVIHSEP